MQWFKKHLYLILALVVAIWAGRMLLTSKHFYTHDDIQVFRLNEFIECIKRGEIPCRWSDSMGKGYGYPLFHYYPPMIYVLPGLIYALGFTLITSLNLFMFATFLLAAWGMYALVKELTKRDELAFFGSILYTLYPFHATNVFIRGVYGENLAWSLAPWLFLGLTYLVTRSACKWLPAVLALIFLTHMISSFVLLGYSIIWVIILIWYYQKPWLPVARRFVLSLALALGLSAFFFVPAIIEKNLVHADTLTQGYYAYTNHFVGLSQLFLDYTWVYGASYFGTPKEEMGFMVGHLHSIIILAVIVFSLAIKFAAKSTKLALLLLGLALFTLFLSHQHASIIYRLLPSLSFVQFPWRFVGWAALPLTLAISIASPSLPKKLLSPLVVLSTVALLIYSSPFFLPREYDNYRDADFIEGELKANQQVSSIYDYLPLTVLEIPSAYSQDSLAPIPIFYFPGWSAKLGDTPVELTASAPHGLIVPVDETIDQSALELTFRETPFRLAMDILSLLTLLGYLLYLRISHVQ